MMHLRTVGSVCALVVAVVAGGQAVATEEMTTFHDETFAAANWSIDTITAGTAGSVTATQQLTGGHNDAYRRITITVNQAKGIVPYSSMYTFHKFAGSTFDPKMQGAITQIEYAEDGILYNGFGSGQNTGLAIWQDGEIYRTGFMYDNQFSWVHFSKIVLSEEDMFRGMLDYDVHPDFSNKGSPIEFGFYRVLITTDWSLTFAAGIDNWSVTVHSVPEPATMLLLAAGGLGLLLRRRT